MNSTEIATPITIFKYGCSYMYRISFETSIFYLYFCGFKIIVAYYACAQPTVFKMKRILILSSIRIPDKNNRQLLPSKVGI